MKELSEMEKIVKIALIKLGIKCDYSGYDYLVDAVLFVIEKPQYAYNVKALIEEVAKKNNCENPQRVESNIQNAINATYNSKGFNSINDLYGMDLIRPDHKPTMGELIKLVAEYYNLKIYENEEKNNKK